VRSLIRSSAVCAAFFVALAVSALAQPSASVTGSVNDESGAAIAGAVVGLKGPSTYTTTSNAAGAFSFQDVAPGLYELTVRKTGYTTAVQGDIAIIAGQAQRIAVRLSHQTFSSLRTIASVSVNGHGTINTSPASVNVVSAQEFIDQSQPQVTRVLSQVPGVQISFPSNSANAAAPGSITIPNIRGATSYETASLIDGHPISVGQYGDNVTTFLNAFMFGSIEVIKGPGADSPVVNNAIGGTTNFETKNPTLTASPQVIAGVDNHGGTFSNFGISDTLGGKLGFVVDVATQNNASALNGKQVYFDPAAAYYPSPVVINGDKFTDNSSSNPLPPTASYVYNQYPLLACCYELYGNLDQTAELFKVRYAFSGATRATVSYLDGQSYSDQNGNTSDFINSQFTPDPSYTGSLKPGTIQVANIFPGSLSSEFNNEPIFQAEVSTTLGQDTLLARFYRASILRYQYQGSNANSMDTQNVTLFGSNYDVNNNLKVFNGTPASIAYPDFYQEPEFDKLSGGSFEYQHPIGSSLITLSVDRTYAQSTDYSVFSGPFYSFNLPPGTDQTLTTYLLRGHVYPTAKLEATLSDYLNTYHSDYPVACAGGNCSTYNAAVLGTGVTFNSSSYAHNDPRLGLVYRPNVNSSIRFAVGSSIAPPFMGLLNQVASTPTLDASNPNVALTSISNGSIKPETAWGYDLGGDLRLRDGVTLSGDVYLTNLYNRFFQQSYPTNETCSTATPCVDQSGNPVTNGVPILKQINTNISNARFEGIELVVQREPAVGFGFRLSGALEKGYYYDLPPYFYCSAPGPGCTYDQNLNIITGENTNGVGVGVGGLNYNGNMRIPYSQGDLQFSYRFENGAYAMIGETYYGTNNSLNEPPFGIGYATLRYPIRQDLALQVSGDNIFNAWPGYLPILGGGVPIPLANGTTAATTGNVLGPATYRFSVIYQLP
jgi:outer membrane receptor protein involved in Fe transport